MMCTSINWIKYQLGFETSHPLDWEWILTPTQWILKWILALICRCLLRILGWNLLDPLTYKTLESSPRSMVIFSHSSYWDFILFTLYNLSYPHRLHTLNTLINPGPFKYFGSLLRHLGGIEATRIEDKHGGATNRIINHLSPQPHFVFFLSPKGSLRNTPWRSGYYHIAKTLNLPIFIAGLDYEQHRVMIFSHPPIDQESLSTMQEKLQSSLSNIVPLHPEGEVVPVRHHQYRSVINWNIYVKALQFVIKICARIILFVLGWKGLSRSQIASLNYHTRAVVVFSHTSYVDFYLLWLYLLAYPGTLGSVRTLVKPDPFAYAGWLLRYFGAIPATQVDAKNGGSVAKIIQTLRLDNRFLFFISPKGSIVNRPWRNGYYVIATEMKIPLFVAGLDYEQRAPYVSENSVWYDQPRNQIDTFLKQELSQIVPLFPSDEVVPIRKHQPPTAINKWRLGMTAIVALVFLFLV